MSPTPIPSPPIDWIANIDPYFKFFTAVIAGLVTLFGLPVAFLEIRKTIAEIRKLELETKQIKNKGTSATPQ